MAVPKGDFAKRRAGATVLAYGFFSSGEFNGVPRNWGRGRECVYGYVHTNATQLGRKDAPRPRLKRRND